MADVGSAARWLVEYGTLCSLSVESSQSRLVKVKYDDRKWKVPTVEKKWCSVQSGCYCVYIY